VPGGVAENWGTRSETAHRRPQYLKVTAVIAAFLNRSTFSLPWFACRSAEVTARSLPQKSRGDARLQETAFGAITAAQPCRQEPLFMPQTSHPIIA
jgi:hypothetical protein